jgi:hypothetical protein
MIMPAARNRARKSSPLYLPGAFELFTPSKAIILKNIWIFGPLYAVPLVFWIHSWIWSPLPTQHVRLWQHSDGFSSGWIGSPLPIDLTFLVVGFSILWFLLIIVIGTIVQIMTQAAQLEAAQSKHLDFQNLWQTLKKFGWRITGLYITMSLIILIGFILLFVPGLFMIRRYILAPYAMLDKNLSIREALDQSARLSKRNTGAIWGVLGVMLLIGFINIIPIIGGLASFVFGSLYSIAPALRYQQLKQLA